MVKLIAMYKTPPDIKEFEKHYFEVHMPMIEKMPGLLKTEVSRISGMPGQESKYHIMSEMYFESMDKLNESMASPEGRAAGKDLMGFAKDYVIMMFGEVKE
jgi:uncharacterized protein (TIGR02118 family)